MNHINEMCAERGMSQKDLALALNVDPGLMSKFSRGHCLPNPTTITAMESVLRADRLAIYDFADLDLLGGRKAPKAQSGASEKRKPSLRKCYRISPQFARSIPADVLEVCGYSNWQAWHYAALKRLLGEYAARVKHMKKEKA